MVDLTWESGGVAVPSFHMPFNFNTVYIRERVYDEGILIARNICDLAAAVGGGKAACCILYAVARDTYMQISYRGTSLAVVCSRTEKKKSVQPSHDLVPTHTQPQQPKHFFSRQISLTSIHT